MATGPASESAISGLLPSFTAIRYMDKSMPELRAAFSNRVSGWTWLTPPSLLDLRRDDRNKNPSAGGVYILQNGALYMTEEEGGNKTGMGHYRGFLKSIFKTHTRRMMGAFGGKVIKV